MAQIHLLGQRPENLFVRGQGSWLWDAQGRAFLDFSQGRGSNSFGHSPSLLLDVLRRQAEHLLNPGQMRSSRAQLKLASRLCEATGSEGAMFVASAEQANAQALRLAMHWAARCRPQALDLVLLEGSHADRGAPGGQIRRVPFNDLDALARVLDARCAALLVEPLQVDAGGVPATLDYMQTARRLCHERGVLLVVDETRSGMGRCGALLAEELYGVRADVLTLGSGLGGGLPLAAVLARGEVCSVAADLALEDFPGDALLTAAGVSVLGAVLENGFLAQVNEVAQHLREGLACVARRHGHGPLRGHGLLLGLQLIEQSAPAVASAAAEQGLLIDTAGCNCLRLTPALTVSHGNVEEMLRRLARAFERAGQPRVEVA